MLKLVAGTLGVLTLVACGPRVATSTSSLASTEAEPDACRGPDIRTLQRPVYPGRLNSPQFNFKYAYTAPKVSGAPTVIYIPGGPGDSSIAGERLPFLPPEFGQVLTDPRGVGCNMPSPTLPDDSLRTVWLASDLLAMIQQLGLTSYILYGVSYGSMLATETASLGESTGGVKPQAVVLEGVLGRAFQTREELYGSYQSIWAKYRDKLPATVKSQLSGAILPFGATTVAWGATLSQLLIHGDSPETTGLVDAFLAGLEVIPTGQDHVHNLVDAAAKPGDAAERRLYRVIACNEIAQVSDDDKELLLSQGELVAKAGTICPAGGFSADKYDAALWPITTPIYYFEGEDDPSTPVWQARYHEQAQTKAKRTFALVKGGGHGAFTYGLSDCGPALLNAIATGEPLAPVTAQCRLPVTVDTIEKN